VHRVPGILNPDNFLGRRWLEERKRRHLLHRLPQTFSPRLEFQAGSVLTLAKRRHLCSIGPLYNPSSL
jgi:hypothetical protein